jgi:hypothetical protein
MVSVNYSNFLPPLNLISSCKSFNRACGWYSEVPTVQGCLRGRMKFAGLIDRHCAILVQQGKRQIKKTLVTRGNDVELTFRVKT